MRAHRRHPRRSPGGAAQDAGAFTEQIVPVFNEGGVVTDDEGRDLIAIRHMVFLSLSYDHRLVDGADAARFLTDLKNRYEHGSFEL